MKVLIISSGLKPERFGGLPSHVEDLLHALVGAGVSVAYLNTGAKSKWPITRLWERKGLPCPAWNLSSKLSYAEYWKGTRHPLAQVTACPGYRKAFLSVINAFKPDLVHVHELTGFPVELFRELRRRNVKTIFSAADFYAVCPTVKLFRPDHSLCDRKPDQLDCQVCSKNARSERANQWAHANEQWLGQFVKLRNLGRRLIRGIGTLGKKPCSPEPYIKRRNLFEEIFREVDVILATSRAQQRIFGEQTNSWNIRFLQRSRATIRSDSPTPRTARRNVDKLVFVALNIVNPAKGLSLLEDAFAAVHKDYPEVELHLYGLTEGRVPGIRYFGPYDDDQLDSIIESADFGILPSIWPEAFGYVGPEMLSRGLPVLASNRGAMPDYVIHDANGLLFDPATPSALEQCLRQLVMDESLCGKLWEGAASGERHYLSMQEHTEKLLTLYRQICAEDADSQND